MNNFEIVNFYPSQKQGNFLGYAGLRVHLAVDNIRVPIAIKVKVMRNSNNGHVFISMPSEEYTAKDGTKKYSDIIRVDKEFYEIFQKACSKAWDEYIATKQPSAEPTQTQGDYYPHGLARRAPDPNGIPYPSTASIKPENQDNLPF